MEQPPCVDPLVEGTRALLSPAVEAAGIPWFAIDVEGAILDANEHACAALGYTRDELLALSVEDVDAQRQKFVQVHTARERSAFWRSRPLGEPFIFQSIHRRKDGSTFPLEVRTTKVEVDGQPVLVSLAWDISHRPQQEAVARIHGHAMQQSSPDPSDLLMALVDEAEAFTGSEVGAVYLMAPDEQTLSRWVWSTCNREHLSGADEEGTDRALPLVGSWAECARTRAPAIRSHDPSAAPEWGFPECAPPIFRELVVPVVRNDRLMAILGVANKQTEYDQGDVEALSQLADQGWDIVMRRVAEEEAVGNEARIRHAVDSSLDGFAVTDLEGRLLDVNEAFCNMVGYAPDEIRGTSISDLSGSPPEEVRRRIEQIVTRGGGRLRTQTRRKDGTLLDVEISATHFPGNGGRIVAFLRDVSVCARLDADLQSSRHEYATLVEHLPDLVMRLDADGRLLVVSPNVVRLGFPAPAELVGRTPWEVGLSIGDFDDWRKMTAGTSRDENREKQVKLATPVGERIFNWRLVAEGDDGHGGRSFLAIGRDVTAQVQVESELRRSEQRFRSVFERSPLPFFLLTTERTILASNESFRNLMGCAPGHLVGRPFTALADPDDVAQWREGIDSIMADGPGATEVEARCVTRTGETVWLRANMALVRDDRGEPEFIVVLGEDLTQQKAEETLRNELERQLRQAQKMEAIGALAGGIAHDFNNILGALMGYSELALEDAEDPNAVRQEIREVLRAAERAKALVAQILAFSRQGEQERQAIHLAPLVKEAGKLLRATIPASIHIELDVDERAWTVVADASQLHQVIMNLCTNAFQALKPNPGAITIRLAYVEDLPEVRESNGDLEPGPYAVLEVSDTGPGMDEEVRARVFDPYFTTKPAGQGTGLGLSIVERIATAHGGAVTLHSAPGEGARFSVYLPVAAISSGEENRIIGTSVPARGTERVLFVDDEEALCDLAEQELGRLGYQVHTMTHPGRALAWMKAYPGAFDVLVTDLTMPGMTGLDLIEQIRTLAPDMPVVLCSGFAETGHLETARAMGVESFLAKPVTTAQLSAAIREAVVGTGRAAK